jgi:HAD superfamily hydrolase (TIGR01490 family)
MGRRFAVFDIDGTIIRWQLVHATMDALGRTKHIAPEDYKTLREARKRWKNRTKGSSFMAYQDELIRVIHKNMAGLPVSAFEAATHSIFDEYKDQVYLYTRELIKDLKSQGYLLFAVSGSHEEAVGLLAEYYGFDDYVATVYERENGKLTGGIQAITGGKDKLVLRLMKKHNASLKGSIAVGDSEGDIGMLNLVEQPIAFNPSKKLFQEASAKGWRVVLERKSVIYELAAEQGGYRLDRTNA